jgi:hypothetical protein
MTLKKVVFFRRSKLVCSVHEASLFFQREPGPSRLCNLEQTCGPRCTIQDVALVEFFQGERQRLALLQSSFRPPICADLATHVPCFARVASSKSEVHRLYAQLRGCCSIRWNWKNSGSALAQVLKPLRRMAVQSGAPRQPSGLMDVMAQRTARRIALHERERCQAIEKMLLMFPVRFEV